MGAEEEKTEAQRPINNLITKDQFLSWKQQKDAEVSARKAEAARKRAEDIAAGLIQMNGRELFVHDPSVFDNTLY
ncbi:uncharacterized protein [Rutidosis leptorrhynchoides]|uniref:uncharacterized protein n=1 Tax=Rutidosis leptorrhynchoides TaxID=125765 RepID=UPI003A995BB6